VLLQTGVYSCTGTSRRCSLAVQSQQVDASSSRFIRRRQLTHVHGQHCSTTLQSPVTFTINSIYKTLLKYKWPREATLTCYV